MHPLCHEMRRNAFPLEEQQVAGDLKYLAALVDKEQFVFGSEMKALWAAGIAKKTDNKMLLNYITLGHVQNPNDKEHCGNWSLVLGHWSFGFRLCLCG